MACEAALLDLIEQSLRRLGTDILHKPIWIIVPSVSLRAHLLAAVVRHFGRSISGLACWTLRGLATDIVARAGSTPPPAGELLPLLVHRLAAAEAPLRRSLDHLADGYSAVVRSVRDLLDAGLAEGHRDALEEVLSAEGRALAGGAAVERAQSLIRVGCSLLDELGHLGIHHDAQILEVAAERVRFHDSLGVEPGELLVYGFSDATGLATDLIVALLERPCGQLILDLPPAPGESPGSDGGSEFIRRFRERIESVTRPSPTGRSLASPPPHLELIRGYGADSECREVAIRIRHLISEGAVAERIGVVARQIEPYSTPLRRHFFRLGLPFSGVGVPGPQLPLGRQTDGFAELLRLGAGCRVDRWLELRIDRVDPSPDFDLRLALFGLGASTIAEVAELDLSPWSDTSTYPLPARYGLEADGETGRERLVRRSVPMEALRRIRAQAADLAKALSDRNDAAPWYRQVERLRRLGLLLGWETDTPIAVTLEEVWSRLQGELPAELPLSGAETERLIVAALRDKGRAELGGQGSGVQVLDVIAARSRTFDHLFLLGLNQGVFPRTIRDDPLLDDSLRRVIAREGHGVLPDLGRKRLGHAEERYLFSQLLRSSSSITLSWQYADDDGKPQIASPLLRRLQLEAERDEDASSSAETARHPFALHRSDAESHPAEEVFTPYEQAVRTALWAERGEWSPSFRLALADARAQDPAAQGVGLLADARLSILNEYDQKPFEMAAPGPYFGFAGPPAQSAESPSCTDLYITTLEAMARCPWQTFLQRMLRLEVHPDPTEQLPGIDARALGQMVHRCLESIVGRQLQNRPSEYASVLQIEPSTFAWPVRSEVDRILWGQAHRLVRELGLSWVGLSEILVSLARPFVDQAADALTRSAEPSKPVAVEAEGELTIGGSTVRFRADRVDRRDQSVVGIDYKTGVRPISSAKQEKTRRRHWLDAIRSGALLQATAYSLATGRPNDGGEYLYLHPDLGSSQSDRVFAVQGNDEESKQTFLATTEALLTAWGQGIFFPRLVDPEPDREPEACKRCDVSEACLRGDSGARIRLRRYLLGASPSSSPFHRAWYLTDDAGSQRGRP